jgi:hypothetical protein
VRDVLRHAPARFAPPATSVNHDVGIVRWDDSVLP